VISLTYFSAQVATAISLVFGLITASLLLVFHRQIPFIFTNDLEVTGLVSQSLIVAALYQIPDSLVATNLGTLRGLGLNKISSRLTIFVWWICSIPVGYYMAFNLDLKLLGLMGGCAVGSWLMYALSLVTILRCDWHKAVREAAGRNSESW
jgi:MATE family multidrug resistance protein